MTEQEKSLELAKLMGWKITTLTGGADWHLVREDVLQISDMYPVLEPYAQCSEGLAQFAAILLKNPEVMMRFNGCICPERECEQSTESEPTQENILDEILRINGVKI